MIYNEIFIRYLYEHISDEFGSTIYLDIFSQNKMFVAFLVFLPLPGLYHEIRQPPLNFMLNLSSNFSNWQSKVIPLKTKNLKKQGGGRRYPKS